MENLEEVLQALDEFQKMRPSEIPRELEDYLCWVAKTGDPVYQWSMIKTLFREKLTRVMTDFYESCPTLELGPCPNVEHFNYDTMKSNLLERLESFANAPFTVQRICELLTAPRKEYNRVDKFMRAIEKNILVVSTREPGPIARSRGETGDGMVNGSIEEDTALVTQQQQSQPLSSPSSPSLSPSLSQSIQLTQSAQPVQQPTSQDVEMEYWEKDCASTVTISVHTVENEPPLLHTIVPSNTSPLTKNTVFSMDESTQEKLEQATSRTDQLATSTFISAASDFSTISNLTSQVEQSHKPVVAVSTNIPVVQNLLTTNAMVASEDSSAENADVTETIMNENTNSQSSLENQEIEAATKAVTTTMTTMTTSTSVSISTLPSISTSVTLTSTSATTTTVTVVATVIPLTTDTTRKLQAAFQTKRFASSDSKNLNKTNEKAPALSTMTTISVEEGIVHSMKNRETIMSTNSEYVDSNDMSSHNESRLRENLLKTDIDIRSDILANNTKSVIEERISSKSEEENTSILEDVDEENVHAKNDREDTKTTVFIESQAVEKDNMVISDEGISAVIVSTSTEALYKTEKTEEIHSKEVICLKENFIHNQSASQQTDSMEVTDKILEFIPRIESFKSDDDIKQLEVQNSEFNTDSLKMMEVSNDKNTLKSSMVMESIRIVGNPKAVVEELDAVSPTIEMTDSSEDSNIICQLPKDDKLIRVEDNNLTSTQGNKTTACIKGKQSSVIDSIVCRRKHESMELMEVDDEESTSIFQDEQMEQETMKELSKS